MPKITRVAARVWALESSAWAYVRLHATEADAKTAAEDYLRENTERHDISALEWRPLEGDPEGSELWGTSGGKRLPGNLFIYPMDVLGSSALTPPIEVTYHHQTYIFSDVKRVESRVDVWPGHPYSLERACLGGVLTIVPGCVLRTVTQAELDEAHGDAAQRAEEANIMRSAGAFDPDDGKDLDYDEAGQ